MKKSLLFFTLFTGLNIALIGQTVLDYETDENSLIFQYFGSSLGGSLTATIDNPNASGINTSAKVAEFKKPAGAETWAGGFANPAPAMAIDATNGGQVCIKVHFDHIGNLALKLEQPSEGENWITTLANTKTGEWEELCFDLAANSIEDSNLPATGRTFGQMVLFFDFGISPDVEQTYYMDDITYTGVVGEGGGTSNVSFAVDMNAYMGEFVQVYVSGSLNGWAGDANPLKDEDGDGVWSGIIPLDNGTYEYKFTLDNWAVQEQFAGGEDCTLTTGEFTNRLIEVNGDAEVCFAWNTCDACGEGGESTCSTIYDFETEETSTNFQLFGSSLEGSLTAIIDNPNASGVNTSSKVVEYIKPAGAQTWAGAFANPAPITAIDATNGGQVCVKVHFDHIGNLAFKLEQSSTGGEDWITTVANTKIGEWEELCFDLNAASIEGGNAPATGHIYAQMVLFFDFGVAGGDSDVTYYFDDIDFCSSGVTVPDQEITFSVDMSNYSEAFTQVYVSGSMNGWAGDANPLNDEDGDGVWTTTMTLPTGAYEYKFTLDNWTVQEQFSGSETCTKLTLGDNGERFVNRLITVTADGESPPTACFNSCFACGESATITFNLGMTAIEAAESGVFLAGGAEFGPSNEKFRLMDEDGDGVFSLTIERPLGYSTYYTFTNGNCPDFSCKENIAGQDCARPENFNDRFLDSLTGDVVINTCFAECTTDTNCQGATAGGMLTFSVDMSKYEGAIGTVYVSGTMNGWSGDANPLADEDGDSIWSGTFEVSGGLHEYKFTIDNWAVQEQFDGGEDCTITDPSGQFTNRRLEVNGDASICFEFNTCTSCATVGTEDLIINNNLFNVSPTLAQNRTILKFEPNNMAEKQISLFNIAGIEVQSTSVEGLVAQYQLSLTNLEAGIYWITVQTETMIATKRIVKQ